MNTILRKITIECWNTDIDYFYKKIGNYKIKRDGERIIHYYYNNVICIVYLWAKRFYLNSCGYNNYKLTTAQLNFLEQFYQLKGFYLKERK